MLLCVAGAVHFAVAQMHFDEWWLFGAFMVASGTLQLLGALAFAAGYGQKIATAVAWGSLAIVVLWTMTRTTGLPIGPGSGTPEATSWIDILATTAEMATAVVCFAGFGTQDRDIPPRLEVSERSRIGRSPSRVQEPVSPLWGGGPAAPDNQPTNREVEECVTV
ncbi:MAG: hypothetical protein ACRDVP_09380 [Acidimicrobiales bacterium]